MAPKVLGIAAVVLLVLGFWPVSVLCGLAAILVYSPPSTWGSQSGSTAGPARLTPAQGSASEDRLAVLEERVFELEERVDEFERWAAAIEGTAGEPFVRAPDSGPAPAIAPIAGPALSPTPPPVPPAPPAARSDRPARSGTPVATTAAAMWTADKPDATTTPPVLEPAPARPSIFERAGRSILGAVGPSGTSAEAIESWLSGRLLAVVGGIALLLGAIFFLSLAFSRGWISEPLRVVIALFAGSGLMGLAVWLFGRRFEMLGNVLIAVGLAVVSLAFYAAAPLYGLVAVELALVGALAAAVVAAGIAIRFNSQLVAAMGLVSLLAAPPVLGASPNLATVAFLAVALVGTTAVALFRSWRWLPPIAFVLSAPQLVSYVLGDVPALPAVAVVLAYWALHALAAGGEEWRARRSTIVPSSVTLLLSVTVLAIWAGFTILDEALVTWRGPFLVALAAGHGLVAGLFLRREGDRHPFGLIAAGTGVAAFSMAVPVHFGGPPVPIAWAAEAAALAWVATVRRHEYSALVSAILGMLAILHLVFIEYPLGKIAVAAGPELPFIGPNGATLAFLVGSIGVIGVFVTDRSARTALGALVAALVAYAAPFELSGVALVAAWSAIFAVCVVAERFVVVPGRAGVTESGGLYAEPASWLASLWALRPASTGPLAIRALMVPAVAALAAAVGHILAVEYAFQPIEGWAHETPFYGVETLAPVAVLGAIGIATAAWPDRAIRAVLLSIGALVLTYVMPAELMGVPLVAAWAAIFVLAVLAERFIVAPERAGTLAGPGPLAIRALMVPAVAALVLAIGHVAIREYPLRPGYEGWIHETPFIGVESLAVAAILAALTIVGAAWRSRLVQCALLGIATLLLVYVMPAELAGVALVAGWLVIGLLAFAAAQLWLRIPIRSLGRLRFGEIPVAMPILAAAVAGIVAVGHVLSVELTPADFLRGLEASSVPAGIPFIGLETLTAVLLVVAVGAAWAVNRDRAALPFALIAIGGIVAYLLPFELAAWLAIAGWAALAVGGLVLGARAEPFRVPLGSTAAVLLGLGSAVLLISIAPPARLIVDAREVAAHLILLSPATGASVALVIGFALAAWLVRGTILSRLAVVLSGTIGIYALSIGLVDEFQGRVGGSVGLEELQKQASVGLTVLWAVCGGVAFGIGQLRRILLARYAGLVLLGLATAKAFVVDLAGLDVAYRVLSFVGLGILLLASAYVATRMRPKSGGSGSMTA